jgi:2-iminoacetate synthase
MSFYEVLQKHKNLAFVSVNEADVKRALSKERLNKGDFLALLSKAATPYLEETARRANKLTLQNFGKSILLYTPMYLSNYCVNSCIYCGFNTSNKVKRRKLTLEEVEKEAAYIASFDLQHILILTGEAREKTPLSYIKKSIKILKHYFSSISIEIFPLRAQEYRELIDLGIDGLTIYQEVYDEKIYDEVHVAGPKKDYKFRLGAPERAAKAGIRTLNIGALLGLGDFRSEAFLTGLHANYLQNKFMDVEVSVSVPRIQPHTGNYEPNVVVEDKDLVQIILALRLFMPRAGITLSTRENSALRNNLLPLGITKMSANSTTSVGGHTIKGRNSKQFNISDSRSIAEMKSTLLTNGYQPIFKDWIDS